MGRHRTLSFCKMGMLRLNLDVFIQHTHRGEALSPLAVGLCISKTFAGPINWLLCRKCTAEAP
jgi:hypothetical protein